MQVVLLLKRDEMALLERWDQATSLISLQGPSKALFNARGRFERFRRFYQNACPYKALRGPHEVL